MYATNFFETKILNLARSVNITAPQKMYIGLFINNPEDAGGGTEISYTGYTRKEIKFDAPATSGTGLEIKNSELITFSESNSTAGTVSYIGIFDAVSGGNMWLYGQLGTSIDIQSGVSPVIRAGMIKFIMTGNLNTYYRTAILNTLRGTSCPGFNAHLALMGGNPDSGGTEFSGSAYSRVPIRFNAPSEQPNGNSQMSNSELVVSPEATGFWGNLTHVSIYDAASNGHPYITIPLSVSYNMIAGTVCQFQVGRFKINVN